MTKSPPPKPLGLAIPPIVAKSILFFLAILASGFIVLWTSEHKSVVGAIPKLLTLASSGPVLAILTETWKAKKANEEFISKRKQEVNQQFETQKEAFNQLIEQTKEELRLLVVNTEEKLMEKIRLRDLETARMKAEIKSSTRVWQVSDGLQELKIENEELKSRIALLENQLKNNDENPMH